MDRRFVAILAGLIIIFAGIFVFSQRSSNESSGSNGSNSQPTNHVEGEGRASVTLLEYGDYQCSACQAFAQTTKEVVAQFSQQIYYQFRNLPLTSIHPNAFAAARAAEAAGMQNKFFEMHDALYSSTNWQAWTNASNPIPLFNNYAQQLGLDIDQFNNDYASEKVNSLINSDIAEFKKTGQEMATPTLFLNGKVINNGDLLDSQSGRPSAAKFAQIIRDEIAKKSQQ